MLTGIAVLVQALALITVRPPVKPKQPMFTLTKAHVSLLRKSMVVWVPAESGAPAVAYTPRLLESEAPTVDYADVAARAGLAVIDKQQLDRLIEDLPQALLQMLAHGRLEAGTYTYVNQLAARNLESLLPSELAAVAHERVVSFALTGQHLKLLRHARWDEMVMNPKRPYGDMTYFELDMADILGEPSVRNGEGQLPAEQEHRLQKLHAETLPALQIYLEQAKIAPGEYPMLPSE